jgi:hypothetical protein
MRFPSLQRQAIRVHLPRAYLPRYVPLPGFLNLLAVYSSNRHVVLFRTTRTLGIRPAECSPRMKHRILVRNGSPLHKATGFNIRVRSHPTLGLPSVGGRYSHEPYYPVYFARFKISTRPSLSFRLVRSKLTHSLAVLPYKPEYFAK